MADVVADRVRDLADLARHERAGVDDRVPGAATQDLDALVAVAVDVLDRREVRGLGLPAMEDGHLVTSFRGLLDERAAEEPCAADRDPHPPDPTAGGGRRPPSASHRSKDLAAVGNERRGRRPPRDLSDRLPRVPGDLLGLRHDRAVPRGRVHGRPRGSTPSYRCRNSSTIGHVAIPISSASSRSRASS